MTRREQVAQLRADKRVHYNCCQSVLLPFCQVCGLERETAFKLGEYFNAGMRMGAVCGAVTGGLMVLGMAGAGEETVKRFREEVQGRYGALDCAALLKRAQDRGLERKPHCDAVVEEAVALVEQLLLEEGRQV